MVERRRFLAKALHPLFVLACYTFIYLPMLVLILFSFNESEISTGWSGFTLKWYKELFLSTELWMAFTTSLFIAFCATLVSVGLGLMFVIGSKWWRKEWMEQLFLINVVLPDIVVSIGILSMFSLLKIPYGYERIILGHSLICLGFVVPILKARFTELDPSLTEASLDLGATYMQTLWKIIIPLMTPALLAAGLVAFTLSLDDFLVAFFCAGPNIQTLSIYVYNTIRSRVDPTINAISTCLLVASSLVAFFLSTSRLFRRENHE